MISHRSPGLVDTEIFDHLPAEAKQQILTGHKLLTDHVGTPEEVAEAYIFAMKVSSVSKFIQHH